MKFGVFLPVSGRAAGRQTLMQAAQRAEARGYDSVWAADRVVMPWKIDTSYPYSKEATFIVPPDRPFFDTLTCLAFLAGCTEKIQLGMSVMVLPYRHPLHWALGDERHGGIGQSDEPRRHRLRLTRRRRGDHRRKLGAKALGAAA